MFLIHNIRQIKLLKYPNNFIIISIIISIIIIIISIIIIIIIIMYL